MSDVFTGIDFYIGVPREQFYRVSKNHDAKLDMEFSHDPSLWSLLWMAISGSNPYFSLAMTVQDVVSSRSTKRAGNEIPAEALWFI